MTQKWPAPILLATSLSMVGVGKSFSFGIGGAGVNICRDYGSRGDLRGVGAPRKDCAECVGGKQGSENGRPGIRAFEDSERAMRCLLRYSSCRRAVFTSQELFCTSKSGGRRTSGFAGYSSSARSSQQPLWLQRSHISKEKTSSQDPGQQDGTEDNSGPGTRYQPKKLSFFRSGSANWSKRLIKNWSIQKSNALIQEPPKTRSVENTTPTTHVDTSNLTVICFDIETTGFSARNDRIIEFAARDLAGGECSTIETLVNPQKEVTNDRIHKINSQMVNNPDVPKWEDVGPAILDFVESRRQGQGVVILVAHNGKRFDVPFIMSEFHACGISIPPYWRFADSLALAKLAMKNSVPGKNRVSRTALGQLFTHYNLEYVGEAHRAMADVNMLAQVLQMLMQDLEMSTAQLLTHSFSADDVVLKHIQ